MGGNGTHTSARRGLTRSGPACWATAIGRALAAAGAAVTLATGMLAPAAPVSAAASGWHVQPTPDPPSRTGALAADSCTSPTACMAVGSYKPAGVFYVPLAERWDGTSWTVQKPPVPAGAQTTQLLGVSCVSASHCVAVGTSDNAKGISSPLAEVWNGTAWSIQLTPMPTGGRNNGLASVSCTSANACTAVGFTGDYGFDSTLTLAEVWNGTAWSIQPTPNPASPNHANLTSVSCTSPGACIAVGSAAGFEPLAERWDGTSWSLQKPPAPAGATGGILSGVSCTAGGRCTAVGNYRKSAGGRILLAESWDGTSWTIRQATVPAGASRSFLNGVSCLSASACTAVGNYQSGKLAHVPLAERWNGTSWSIQPVPGPGAPRSGLAGVSCLSAGFCAAAGSQTSRWQVPTPLAEAWNGTAWSIEKTPAPATFTQTILSGVACPTAADCFAVGSSGSGSGFGTLAERWDGSSWSIQQTPVTGGIQDYLGGIACTSATSCEAVGGVFAAHGGRALAEAWNGSSWSVQKIPSAPPHNSTFLAAVSCASPSSCVAVGNAGGSPAVPIAETWNGSSWSIRMPVPAGPGDSSLASVSCVSPGNCIAVGAGDNTSTGLLPLAERWDGTSWSTEPVPRPAGAVRTELSGVACTSAGACLAVGDYQDHSGTGFPLAERWDGTSWSIQAVSGPAGSTSASLSALSCTSVRACTAVGGYSTSTGSALMAEVWDGTSWSVQPAAMPKNVIDNFLSALACSSPGVCTAVGGSTTKINNQGASADQALAEAEP